ncbi:MAG TPA: hypothetical protein VF715_18985 [Thermoleophilaceae bacterium]
MPPQEQPSPGRARSRPARAREGVGARVAGIACLAGIALTHALDLGHKWDEAPYVGVLFVLAIVASGLLALLLAAPRPPRVVWDLAGGLALSLMAGYFVSRTVGLPRLDSHVGHWRDAAGSASLVFEAMLVGLALAPVRPVAARLAPAVVFLAFGMLGGAAIAGEVGGHHGHSGHSDAAHSHGDGEEAAGHDDAGGAGHADAGGDGHEHGGAGAAGGAHPPGHVNDVFALASPGQVDEVRAHLSRARETARVKFPSFDAARAAGYVFAPRSFEKQKDHDYWHLSRPDYMEDSNYVDPTMPETLMYWKNPGGEPVLLAFVYRVPRSEPNPPLGGPIVQWHLHTANGKLGRLKMSHVWLVPGLREAFRHDLPKRSLERTRGITLPKNGTGAGV